MRVFLLGATGFVGRALTLRLRRDRHTVVAWVRNLGRARTLLGDEATLVEASSQDGSMRAAMQGCDAVINLAGEPIAQRWSGHKKQDFVVSRVGITERVVQAMSKMPEPPRVLVNASAVGYYGDRGDARLNEDDAPGNDFLAQLCQAWENAANAAEKFGVRVVTARFGVVLGHEGGMLDALLPLFDAGLGAKLAQGKAFVPWIHLHDLVDSLVFALTHEIAKGPYVAAAPVPVDNATFTQLLAKQLHRPGWMAVPGWTIKLMLGEASTFVLASTRAMPDNLVRWGFTFKFNKLEDALSDLLGGQGVRIGPLSQIATKPMAPPTSTYLQKRTPRYMLQATTRVSQPLDEVFAFFGRAQNLGLMTPKAMALTIQGPPPPHCETGTSISYSLALGPIPLRWRTVIEAWQEPAYFVDAQHEGPYRCWWHEHHFKSKGGRTLMEDRVFYAPPGGALFAVPNALVVQRKLERIFAYRRSAITLRFGAEV